MVKKKLTIYLKYIICKHGLNLILLSQKMSVIVAQFHSIGVKTCNWEGAKGIALEKHYKFFFPKKLLHVNDFLNDFFVTCKKYLNVLQCITIFFLSLLNKYDFF